MQHRHLPTSMQAGCSEGEAAAAANLEVQGSATGRRKPVQPHLGGELLRQLWGLRWDIADQWQRLHSMQVHGIGSCQICCICWAPCPAHRQLPAQGRQLCMDLRLGPRWCLSWRERRLG